MSLHTLTDALEGLNPRAVNTNAAVVTDAQALNRMVGECLVDTALATTSALAERPFFKAKRKCRVTAISFVSASAVTAGATNYFSLLIAKRPASAYATPVNVSTYAADTTTTDDAVAFTPKEIGWGTTYASATSTVFDMAIGDVLTIEVTKSGGSGMTFPVSQVVVHADPRD